ncbi:hypothetical protein HKD37_19G052763 [Glycine soja]
MTHTKKTGQITSEVAKEIVKKIDSMEEQASHGSFVAHGRQDVLIVAIGRPEHPGHVRVVGAGVTIKQYFGLAPSTSHTYSSMALKDLEQLTQQIRDQLEEPIIEKGLALPPEPEVGPSAARVSTKESCVDTSGNDPDTIKVGVEEVRDANALIPVPTEEVKEAMRPAKPTDRPDHEVDDPLYLMTLTIPQLFLKPLQVMWDVTVFGVFNEDFPLYIKHEDLSEIAHSGQCLNISVIQLWIL